VDKGRPQKPPSIPVRSVNRTHATNYLRKAEQHLAESLEALSADRWDTAVLLAIHAAIAEADVACDACAGVRCASQTHADQPRLIRNLLTGKEGRGGSVSPSAPAYSVEATFLPKLSGSRPSTATSNRSSVTSCNLVNWLINWLVDRSGVVSHNDGYALSRTLEPRSQSQMRRVPPGGQILRSYPCAFNPAKVTPGSCGWTRPCWEAFRNSTLKGRPLSP